MSYTPGVQWASSGLVSSYLSVETSYCEYLCSRYCAVSATLETPAKLGICYPLLTKEQLRLREDGWCAHGHRSTLQTQVSPSKMWHNIYEHWALFSESNNAYVASLLTVQSWTSCFAFLKLNFLICINKLTILTLAKGPEVVDGDQHSCCQAVNNKRCNFLYYSYNKVTLPY